MNFADLFSTKYLLDPAPPRESKLLVVFLVLFSVSLVFSLVIKLLPIEIEKVKSRYFSALFIPSILGFVYLFGRYERLPWLGARVFLASILAIMIVWLFINTIWTLRFLPSYSKDKEVRDRFERYLPKPKAGAKAVRRSK